MIKVYDVYAKEVSTKAELTKEKPLKIINAPSTQQYKQNVTG